MLTINLLGEVSIWQDDELVTGWQSRTAEALFIYLACTQRPLPRTTLAEFLWQERDSQQSASNLRVALTLLRKLVGAYITTTRTTIRFNSEMPHQIDALTFSQTAATLEPLLNQPQPNSPAAIAQLETAVGLYRGSFLAGFGLRDNYAFEEWLLLQQEQYQHTAVRLLRRLLQDLTATGQNSRALHYADQLLAINPLNETAHQQKMLLLARDGQLTAALAQYQTCHKLLQEELGILPAPKTSTLADRIRHASQTPRHNLPPAPAPLVGRTQHVAELVSQLTNPTCRLITLVGSGGVGKTRLALEAARQLSPTGYFLNGLRFVSLAELTEAQAIPPLLAAELGLPLPIPKLLAALAPQEWLLVLDNVEQLVDDPATADFLAQLLAHCPHLTLLVTSRQRLHLREEQLLEVRGLPTTAAPEGTAATLFYQVARQTQPDFAPTPADEAAILDICQTLEGLPLGIELAAGWLRHIPCPTIAAELHHSLDLLTSSLRNVPARHRSITAVFDHSWALLTPHQQAVLARLALCHGGFTQPAAQAIARASRADLVTLAEQSLLQQEAGRYNLHPLLRQYGLGRLAELGESEAIGRAHALHFAAVLAGVGDGKNDPARITIKADLPNLRAAWLWAAQAGEMALLGQMLPVWHNFFSIESRFVEGLALLEAGWERLVTAVGGATTIPPTLAADWLGRMARTHLHLGQIPPATALLGQGLAVLDGLAGEESRRGTLIGYQAIPAFYGGDFARAIALAEQSLALATAVDDEEGRLFATSFLGSCHKAVGNYGAATAAFTQAADLYQSVGDELGRGMMLNNLGNVAQAVGDFATAQAHYLACTAIFQTHQHTYGAATALANAGRLANKLGDGAQAKRLLQESLSLKRELRDGRGTAVALIGLADTAVAEGDFAAVRTYLREAIPLATQAGDVKLTLEGQAVEVALAHAEGRHEAAHTLAAELLANPALSQEVRERLVMGVLFR